MSITSIPVRGSNNVNASADINTLSSNTDALAEAQPNGYRNYIIDGDFSQWSNGAGPYTVDGTYNSDMWASSAGSPAGTATVTRQDNIDSDVESYFYRLNVTVAGTGIFIETRLKDVSLLAGKDVSIFLKIKSSTGLTTLRGLVSRFDGSGHNATASSSFAVPSDDTWTWYRIDMTIPDTSGLTITSGNFTRVALQNVTNETFILDIDKVRVIETPENLPDGEIPEYIKDDQNNEIEKLLVTQYYQIFGVTNFTFIASGRTNSVNTGEFFLSVGSKFIQSPTLSESAGDAFTYIDITNNTSTTSVAPAFSNIRSTNGTIKFTITDTGLFAGSNAGLILSVNANDTIEFDARY